MIIALQPSSSGITYTRIPVIYKYENCNSGYSYTFNLYISGSTPYVSIERSVDTYNNIIIDCSYHLSSYIRENLVYNSNNVIYFRTELEEYSGSTLVDTYVSDTAIGTYGYKEYSSPNSVSPKLLTTTTTTLAPTTTTTTTTLAPTTTTTTTLVPTTTTTTTTTSPYRLITLIRNTDNSSTCGLFPYQADTTYSRYTYGDWTPETTYQLYEDQLGTPWEPASLLKYGVIYPTNIATYEAWVTTAGNLQDWSVCD